MSNDSYLTVRELSKWIKISTSKIYTMVGEKQIPHMKVGGKLLFDKEKIKQWMEEKAK